MPEFHRQLWLTTTTSLSGASARPQCVGRTELLERLQPLRRAASPLLAIRFATFWVPDPVAPAWVLRPQAHPKGVNPIFANRFSDNDCVWLPRLHVPFGFWRVSSLISQCGKGQHSDVEAAHLFNPGAWASSWQRFRCVSSSSAGHLTQSLWSDLGTNLWQQRSSANANRM